MRDAFESQEVSRLQQIAAEMDEKEFKYHLDRYVFVYLFIIYLFLINYSVVSKVDYGYHRAIVKKVAIMMVNKMLATMKNLKRRVKVRSFLNNLLIFTFFAD